MTFRPPQICLAKIVILVLWGSAVAAQGAHRPQPTRSPAVVAYYNARGIPVDSFPLKGLTHIIFSFCHLRGDTLMAYNANDTAIIRHLVSLKAQYPHLKVILALGGWGGCPTCSSVFSTEDGRTAFVQSVKAMTDYFQTDGIDLDWEYPALANVPGYAYSPDDKDHFTLLLADLRKALGRKKELSFAAGGFAAYLETSIDWRKVVPLVDEIHLMSYDLVSGFDTITGHHTPLYSTPRQQGSVDQAVRFLESKGVPPAEIVIGAAFYGREFAGVDSLDNGLYRPGKFSRTIPYRYLAAVKKTDSGFVDHWDLNAHAPYSYNPGLKLFLTYDDTASIRLKTIYVISHHLGGIMFWALGDDLFHQGLLDRIEETLDASKNN